MTRKKDYQFFLFWYAVGIIVSVCVLFCSGCGYRSVTADRAVDKWANYRAVVQLVHRTGGGNQRHGSGVVIAKNGDVGLILSCRHVNTSARQTPWCLWRTLPSRTTGLVLYSHPGRGFDTDLALVSAPVPEDVHPVKVRRFNPENGPWRAVGYRDGALYESVATEATLQDDGTIELNFAFVQGMSGGPVFDKYGHVVAVAVGSTKNSGICVNGSNLHGMIETYTQ